MPRRRRQIDHSSQQSRQRQTKTAGAVSNVALGSGSVSVWLPNDMAATRFVKAHEHTLADAVAEMHPARLLEVGSEAGIVGLAAAQNGWTDHVTWMTRDVVTSTILESTLKAVPSGDAKVALVEGPVDVAGEFDVVIVHQQRSRVLTELFTRQAMARLAPNGTMILSGDVQDGIRVTRKLAEELFDAVREETGLKSGRVIVAQGPRMAEAVTEPSPRTQHEADVAGQTITWVTVPGVFSVDDLDPASRLLLETVVLPHKGRVLDMGCGPGALGLYAATTMPGLEVTMVDADIAAVRCAEEGVRRAGLENVRVLPSDGIEAVRNERFNVVLSNPPMHRTGRREIGLVERFVREAAQAIGRKGRLWFVTAPTVPILRTLEELFSEITVTDDEEGRFRVYDAIRRPPRKADREALEERQAIVDFNDGWIDYDFDE